MSEVNEQSKSTEKSPLKSRHHPKHKTMLGKCKPCTEFKLSITTINPNPKFITDNIDSTALSHEKSLTEKVACSFPDANIIYLIFYYSAHDIQHQIKVLKYTLEIQGNLLSRDKEINKTRFRDHLSDRDFTIIMINVF